MGTKNYIEIADPNLQDAIEKNQNDLSVVNEFSKSAFTVDNVINPHPRFAGLVKSIREHRGEKVCIKVPLFEDKHTEMNEQTEQEPFAGQIYMDAMAFGMGQCCLQITYEASSLNHSKYLHDMLIPFTGILSALSAAGPFQKGQVTDNDLRWTVIE